MNTYYNNGADSSRQDAPDGDNIRDAVTWQDSTTFSMALPQVHARFIAAGLDRSLRTLQRYCEQGHLRAAKYPTETGSVWYVDPTSVDTKIEEIRQVQETLQRQPATRPASTLSWEDDTPRHDDGGRKPSPQSSNDDIADIPTTPHDDNLRHENGDAARRPGNQKTDTHAAPERAATSDSDERYVSVPVVLLNSLTSQLDAKDEQLERKDAQIEHLIETHSQDRQLLSAALTLIHQDSFPAALGVKPMTSAKPEPAEEIRPEFGRHGGNDQG